MNQKCAQETPAQVRIDKWLWAARFFKTSSLAAAAVAGGKIAPNGAGPKPSRTIGAGDHLNIRRGAYEWIIFVKGTSTYRVRAHVVVLGAPEYYHQFGFRSADLFGLENEYGASEAFMALELKTGSMTPGLIRYAYEFSNLANAL